MSEAEVIWITVGAFFLGTILSGVFVYRKMHHKVTYMLDAFEDRETNFRFNEKKLFFRNFYITLNRVRLLFEREKKEIAEREHYYGQILERVRTAVVVVDMSPRHEGQILYHNASALNLLGISIFGNIRQLKTVSDQLEKQFEELTEGKEQCCSYYNERGKISISLTAVETLLQGKKVKILMFNDVTDEMAHSEDLSWNKLIRVLTHEIMNTITPIASLSNSLSQRLTEFENKQTDKNDLKTGLDTICSSSNGLIKFVNNYRSLTRIETPKKLPFFVRDLVERVKQLTVSLLDSAGAKLTFVEKSEDVLLYADANQISQILVNMVKNALQAGATELKITAEIDFAEAVVIRIYNNGMPIDEQNKEDIFIPFYTTKRDGTGIGLSISRQMMRLHNGSIDLERSDENGTVFRLLFR